MANPSILAAFERMWQHIVVALSDKQEQIDNKSQVQIITWEDDD